MRMCFVLRAMVVACFAALAAMPAAQGADWTQWQSLPVLDRGRPKPLDTMAREALRAISGSHRIADPESDVTLDATAAYMILLLDWQADRPAADPAADPHGGMGMSPHGGMSKGMSPHGAMGKGMSPHGAMGKGMSPHGTGGKAEGGKTPGGFAALSPYFRMHRPDKWDQAPLILVDSAELREALGMASGQRHISAWDLSQTGIEFLPVKQKLLNDMPSPDDKAARAKYERSIVETDRRLTAYQELRTGMRLNVVPVQDSEVRAWRPVTSLVRAAFDDRNDPTGSLRQLQEEFEKVRTAYREGSEEDFDAASADFLASIREIGPELGDYPSAEVIGLEVAYNHWPPFRIAWILTALAGVCAAVNLGVRTKPLGWLTLGCFVAAVCVMLAGFAERTIITAHAPLTNMYETVVFVAFAAVAMGLICQWIYRQRVIPLVVAAVATLMLVVADNGSGTMSAEMHTLKPILRDNFWLIVHVKVIMLSYAAFALALGIGNVTLGYYLARSQNRAAIAALSNFTYRTLQAGVFLLAAGTITGALWGDKTWGRFWGWDPKEVWALISLLAYAAVLHLRYVGWLGYRSLAALAVLCFGFIISTWFFVNFIGGLHSYGSSGSSAIPYVLGGLALQFVYVGIALLRSTAGKPAADAEA